MNNLVEEINKFIEEKETEIETIKKELEAAKTFKESIEKKQEVSKPEIQKLEVSENQELIDVLKKEKRHGIIHEKAIIMIAKKIMDNKRRFKVTDVRDIMLAAGYFTKNPNRAYNNVVSPLNRGVDKGIFKFVESGIYELAENDNLLKLEK